MANEKANAWQRMDPLVRKDLSELGMVVGGVAAFLGAGEAVTRTVTGEPLQQFINEKAALAARPFAENMQAGIGRAVGTAEKSLSHSKSFEDARKAALGEGDNVTARVTPKGPGHSR